MKFQGQIQNNIYAWRKTNIGGGEVRVINCPIDELNLLTIDHALETSLCSYSPTNFMYFLLEKIIKVNILMQY